MGRFISFINYYYRSYIVLIIMESLDSNFKLAKENSHVFLLLLETKPPCAVYKQSLEVVR